jgi:hypothetical protein
MMLTLALLYYSFYMGFTGQTLYDSWTLSLWNLVFTLVPPFTYGLFEKDVDDTTIYKVYNTLNLSYIIVPKVVQKNAKRTAIHLPNFHDLDVICGMAFYCNILWSASVAAK